jgi:hypothetical protein
MNTVQRSGGLALKSKSRTVEPAAAWNIGAQWGEFVGDAYVYRVTPTIYEVLFGIADLPAADVVKEGEMDLDATVNAHPVVIVNDPAMGLIPSVADGSHLSPYLRDAIAAVESYEDDFREFLAGPPTTVIAGADLPDVSF